ncbi:hypothetical protein E4U42_006460 [Claviceps africana]|uniref:DAGKc domain-containing protein n=1 Tax=Claviceps africana TaxID=83212 RepID=A0A8K0NL19_9HYPO|nr:hypothetical protein E4U42_006460 [Claviceps africana]
MGARASFEDGQIKSPSGDPPPGSDSMERRNLLPRNGLEIKVLAEVSRGVRIPGIELREAAPSQSSIIYPFCDSGSNIRHSTSHPNLEAPRRAVLGPRARSWTKIQVAMEKGEVGVAASGVHLNLEGKKTLSLSSAERSLKLYGTFTSVSASYSCSQRTIPLYNVLWLEISNRKLVIEYAAQPSKTAVKRETWTFNLADEAALESSALEQWVSDVLAQAYHGAQLQKRAYVLVNPQSGPGNAMRRWKNDVLPLFQAARMTFEVVTLEKGGEATEIAEKIDLDKYDTIVACSGDGTPHEIFNGLAKRPDAARALCQMPVSHIPCGSGNAMSCNLYGTHRAALSALGIIKGCITPIDLISITQGDRRYLSFLSQALGIIAESDLGTEHLRWMGGTRFEVGVMMRILRRRCYPCDLAVKVEVSDKKDIKAHYEQRVSKQAALRGPETPAINGATDADADADRAGLPPLKYGTVQDALPEGWQLVKHDRIGNFYCGNMAYMSPGVNYFPAALASDGCMDLVTINGDISPLAAAKLLYSVENGNFFDNAHVQYRKISAYRIIPRDQQDGYISIDGERVPFEPFQAEIHQGLGRVISKRGVYEASGP